MRYSMAIALAMVALFGVASFADNVTNVAFDPADNPNGMCGGSQYGYVISATNTVGNSSYINCADSYSPNFKFNGHLVLDKSGPGYAAYNHSVTLFLRAMSLLPNLTGTISEAQWTIDSINAPTEKICGYTVVNGTSDFIYATIGTTQATGRTYDPLQLLGRLKKNQDNCVCGKMLYLSRLINRVPTPEPTLVYLTGLLENSSQTCQ
jgi:hypothetical protein